MKDLDFEYDGQRLSDYGFIICDFSQTNGAKDVRAISKISFTKVSHNHGKKYSLVGTSYGECVTATFDICKNPDIYDYENREITEYEFRRIAKWLNRHEFLRLRFIDRFFEGIENDACFYDASFNIQPITINETLYGIRLTMETNRPYGYGEVKTVVCDFTAEKLSETFSYVSDDIGFVQPDLVITCKQNGNLTLRNEQTNSDMVIKNCSVGEEINIDGENLIITSSLNAHKIPRDFNFEFLKICNSYESGKNTITANIPCNVVIKYRPVIKISP